MAMKLAFDDVKQVWGGVWKAHVSPDSVRILGRTQAEIGDRSIIAVINPRFRDDDSTLEVDPTGCRVLNTGRTAETLFISLESDKSALDPIPASGTDISKLPPGDLAFLNSITDMSESMRELATRFVEAVRRQNPRGELEYSGHRRRFIERPDNFWTITPQPRLQTFQITVRGLPNQFNSTLQLKPDRPSYSSLKLAGPGDFEEALKVILSAKRRRV